MPEQYQGPERKHSTGGIVGTWSGKWLRLEGDLYVSTPDDIGTPTHEVIAHALNLRRRIQDLRTNSPEQLDAGEFRIDNLVTSNLTRRQIRIRGNSTSLQLPIDAVADQARDISVKVWERRSPGFNVKKD